MSPLGMNAILPPEPWYVFNSGLIWLHAGSDSIIALAYFAIPLELTYLILRYRNIQISYLSWILLAFTILIFGCGSTYLLEVITLWYPIYWIFGGIKAFTALCAIATAILLMFTILDGSALPSSELPEAGNRIYNGAIQERQQLQAELPESREMSSRLERPLDARQVAVRLAYDLKETLDIVNLGLSFLARDPELKGRHQRVLQTIEVAIEDASRIITRVKELGNPHPVKTGGCVDLCQLVAEAVDHARAAIQRESSHKGPVVIESRVSASLPRVRGQTAELQWLLLNLLVDVGQIAAEGKIEIESAIEHEFVVLRVLGERSRTPVDQLASALEPISAGGDPGRTKIILSTAREIMEGLGGSITAADREPHGVIFTLRFPINNNDSPPPILFGCRD